MGMAVVDAFLSTGVRYAPVEEVFRTVIKRQVAILEFIGSFVVKEKAKDNGGK